MNVAASQGLGMFYTNLMEERSRQRAANKRCFIAAG